MNAQRLVTAVMLVAMLLVGGIGWWFTLRPDLHVDASRLSALPVAIDGYRGHDVDLEDAVERILMADFNLQRVYRSTDSDDVVWLYIGYYGTRRGGQPEHTPAQCYPSAGWQIESSRRVADDADHGLRTNEYIVSRDGQRRLVHFWYRSVRRTGMLDQLDLSLDHLRGRLRGGRADGALVRLSTPVDASNAKAARERLFAFARQLEPLLAARWPAEYPI
jgi:EpsI family protein